MMNHHILKLALVSLVIFVNACGDDTATLSHEQGVHNTPRFLENYFDAPKCSTQLMNTLKQPMNEFNLTDCPKSAWGDKNKTQACLKDRIAEFRDAANGQCLDCYGSVAACGASNCKWACMWGACSNDCMNCVEQNCGEAHRQCTGHASAQMPKCRSNRP